MNSKVEWYTSDCRVILWKFDAVWTWEAYFNSFYTLCRLADSVDHRLGVIAEVQADMMLSNGVTAAYKATAERLPLNVRSIAVVGANIWTRTMLSSLRRINPRLGDKIFFADTRFHALQLFCEPMAAAPSVTYVGRDTRVVL